jgi:hypothetical protein
VEQGGEDNQSSDTDEDQDHFRTSSAIRSVQAERYGERYGAERYGAERYGAERYERYERYGTPIFGERYGRAVRERYAGAVRAVRDTYSGTAVRDTHISTAPIFRRRSSTAPSSTRAVREEQYGTPIFRRSDTAERYASDTGHPSDTGERYRTPIFQSDTGHPYFSGAKSKRSRKWVSFFCLFFCPFFCPPFFVLPFFVLFLLAGVLFLLFLRPLIEGRRCEGAGACRLANEPVSRCLGADVARVD